MAIEKEKFFEIIKNVSESKDLSEDNLLQKIKDELYEVEKKLPEEDCGEYNKFKNGLWKDHLFSVKTSNGPVDYTLLHLAIESNNVLMVKLLINKTVRVDMRIKDGSSNGLTALHIAASHGYEEIVQLLLDANANPSLKDDSQGRTPKDVVGTIDNIQNKEIIVKRLETAEKSYLTNSKQKVRDLKPQDESIHHLSQVNHKTQASTAVDGNNASTTLGNDKRKPEIKVQVWGENKKENNSSVQSEQTSSNSITDESSGNTVNEQRRSVKDRVKEIESLQKINATCSSKQAPAIESDSDDSGLELGPETIPSSSNSKLEEIKNQHSKHVAENETRLKTFDKLYEDKSLKQKMQDLESENATLKGKLEENKDQHSKYVAEHEARLEALNKQNQEKSKLQEQEIKNLKSENTKLNGELEEIKNQHSKYVAEHEAKLEAFNKRNEENKLLKQEINNLKSENAKLNSELEKNKNQHSQTSEVSLKKVEKKPPLSKVAYVSLVATSVVGSILSIVSGLSVLSMIAISVTSALVAGGITYKMSKPTTELKEVNIQSSNNKAREI